ncbi:PAS domain-containing sensor histidine kinase [Pseudoduganella chitinolytica]|uniref:histidine kinase n=1 Tax=Pseudoduganella chitinolytica TaxID=34070 RepID=A0ABY8BDE4_9BURK|nr:PAS domain S-box protein [Pseudoduganella chitinolytica]WEF33931.1 PAS domain S-box protein [Pseudoduganella chitinolytica]
MSTPDFGQLILDETPDALVVTTPEGVVLHWTRGAEAVFGYTAAEALGLTLAQLIVPPGMVAAELAVIQATLDQGAANYESMRRAKDGTLLYIDSSSKAIRDPDGVVRHILWSKKDVTALKVTRDAAMAAARFGALVELLPDAIVMANAAGRIVLANSQAEALFGYGHGALRGKPLELLMPARYRGPHVAQRVAYALAPKVRPMGFGRELYGQRASGDEFPVEISLSPVPVDDGVLVMSAIRDIGERKRIELALQEKNAELAAASLAKDQFLSSMSHELRTPLNAIIGFTGTLLMQLPGPVNADQAHQLRTIQSSARHLLSLINDILDITKIASGKVDLHIESFDCSAVLEGVAAMFAPLARQKGLALEVRLPARPMPVTTDRRAVQQIVINLLNNAIKFTEQGSVVLQARSESDDTIVVDVVDTGIGIAPDHLALLFRPFTQLDQGTTRQFEGTGLGLHLSERLAALIGAVIAVRSAGGEGSTFTLRLPARAAPP